MSDLKPISVKLTRAEKRGNKIILVIESDLYSSEVFAVTPFYDEGDKKNQLQAVHFDVKVTEQDGKVEASVNFGNCLNHFTKGHSQLHQSLRTFFLDKKDCARDWVNKESEEYFNEGRKKQVLGMWQHDIEFQNELKALISKREDNIKRSALDKAKEKFKKASEKLEEALNAMNP